MRNSNVVFCFGAISLAALVGHAEVVTGTYGPDVFIDEDNRTIPDDDAPWGLMYTDSYTSQGVDQHFLAITGPTLYLFTGFASAGDSIQAGPVDLGSNWIDFWEYGTSNPGSGGDGMFYYSDPGEVLYQVVAEFDESDEEWYLIGYIQFENINDEYIDVVGWAVETDRGADLTVQDLRVPAPSGVALLALGGLAATRRRR